ncbi:MerR family transcriptional regulator [Stackebrandtia nassauensis]|uniref:Transcriptional regulator, MerR family n=1 Tax=Stackebrandtia nassauensis (strain DSM 44728 / CIP 108903 / NRRL B-16338 / NBRC 102104 / LLR-40K-21) TaxID=446470 RepID=D3QAT6_STANL|nr:MerR family transcriptional regulator [Stackebrandtia nassauensis]ADD44732.1 transcriptional regulator, MerR family [Stackebrandtia nassauensis DSM 44728]
MSDRNALFTIGELARRTGLAVRTIRFWSDEGVVPETTRSATGYRLYDAEAVARLDLVKTLRELGLDLEKVREVLHRQATVADVAAAHARALDVEIRTLKVRRAVLRSVAHRNSSTEEMRIMHKMAKLSAAERQQLLDEFVEKTFEGVSPQAPGAKIAQGMRTLPAELPDDPSPEQVDAWVELAELVSDKDFQARVRQMAVAGDTDEPQAGPPYDPEQFAEATGIALAENVDPASARGRELLDRLFDAGLAGDERRKLADDLETFTDRRVERYWSLLGVLNGWPGRPSMVQAMEWVIAALRASA